MTEGEILQQIRACEARRDDCQKEINKLERQYDELAALKSRFASLQSDFVARQKQQLAKLAAAQSRPVSLRSARSYMESMSRLISGTAFTEATQGLDTAEGRITQERKRIRDLLEDAEQALKKSIQDLQYWREQLRLLYAQAQEEN